jgi:hypothetical protein
MNGIKETGDKEKGTKEREAEEESKEHGWRLGTGKGTGIGERDLVQETRKGLRKEQGKEHWEGEKRTGDRGHGKRG